MGPEKRRNRGRASAWKPAPPAPAARDPQAARPQPRREGGRSRLPRRRGPEGETAARAAPAGGHGGGAQRAAPEGEPRGHGCGLGAVGKLMGRFAAPASRPKRAGQHRSSPAATLRERGAQRPRRPARGCGDGAAHVTSGRPHAPPGARPPRKGRWEWAGLAAAQGPLGGGGGGEGEGEGALAPGAGLRNA